MPTLAQRLEDARAEVATLELRAAHESAMAGRSVGSAVEILNDHHAAAFARFRQRAGLAQVQQVSGQAVADAHPLVQAAGLGCCGGLGGALLC